MLLVAHRGSMSRGLQNSPEGIRLAVRRGIEWVELDLICAKDGSFRCVHGLGSGVALEDCLGAFGTSAGVVIHLKGRFPGSDLSRLGKMLANHFPLEKIIFAGHRGDVLQRMGSLFPEATLARFGLLPALRALGRRPCWDIALVNQVVLCRGLVRALQARGIKVFASCVWEVRSRSSVARLEVDGAFLNLRV